jgi:polysaccharide biosynthesis/export protein
MDDLPFTSANRGGAVRMKRCIWALLVICLGCSRAVSQDISTPAPPEPAAEVEDFVIGAQDVLSINVWREPELSVTVTVRPDGKIGMPLLNDVAASGLTPKMLQENIAQRLERFVTGPHVTVIVVEIHSQFVHVLGSVARPGVYALGGPLTVVELLARAGGLSDGARARDILIVRERGGKIRRFRFDYSSFAEGKNLQQNIQLRSGDDIIIP